MNTKCLMIEIFRKQEYKAFFYRIFLAYVFYFIARVLFVLYNYELLGSISVGTFFELYFHGMVFDTTAIMYANLLFIVLSVGPFYINTKPYFQKILFYVYFFCNLLLYATNFIDFIYFRFIMSRSTMSALESVQNEGNKLLLLGSFLKSYWHVFLLFFVLSYLWIRLYKRINVVPEEVTKKLPYFLKSFGIFVVIGILVVGGIRSDFRYSTRPINLVDANRYVKESIHANIVLNTPFAIVRTINKKAVKKVHFFDSEEERLKYVDPIKQYPKDSLNFDKPNVVVFILESYASEYIGAFNQDTPIENYKGYTPFIDSLAQHSLIFTNAYANGYKSIHGMSSILGGIPSYKDAFTSSPFSNQPIESFVSVLESEGYKTSFFHGAQNGSMGFLGFSNILGIDNYYGLLEYNDESEFDGVWGIWDEPFLQFMKEKLDEEQQPFMSTVFTVTSHEPYAIPEKYQGKFDEGYIPMHKCIGYTDYALRRFFEEAKKSDWYENTIFVMVADHTNHVYYDYYRWPLNYKVPILIYSPKEVYKGVRKDIAQHIDIYPTVVDMMGYDKPFRSWGRSLISDDESFFVQYLGNRYLFYYNSEYVGTFDGKRLTGIYSYDDKKLHKNLIKENLPVRDSIENKGKAMIEDYMARIIDYKLKN